MFADSALVAMGVDKMSTKLKIEFDPQLAQEDLDKAGIIMKLFDVRQDCANCQEICTGKSCNTQCFRATPFN